MSKPPLPSNASMMFDVVVDKENHQVECLQRDKVPNKLLLEFLEDRCERFGDKTVLVDAADGHEVGYTELINMAKAIAGKLQTAGFQAGDIVAFRPNNSIRSMAALLALLFMQCSVILIAILAKRKDLAKMLGDIPVVGSVAMGSLSEDFVSIAKTHDTMKIVINLKDESLWSGKAEAFVAPPPSDPKTTRSIMVFAPKRKDRPRLIEFSHHNVIAAMWPSHMASFRLNLCGITTGTLSFISGILTFLWYLQSCEKCVVLPERKENRSIEAIVDLLQKYKVGNVVLVPDACVELANNAKSLREKLATVRQIATACSLLPGRVLKKLFSGLPQLEFIYNAFATSEALLIAVSRIARNDPTDDVNFLTIGPNFRARIVDPETKEPLEPGQAGELLVKSPTVFMGYYRQEEATNACFINGWLRTRYCAIMDDRGLIRITAALEKPNKGTPQSFSPADVEESLKHCLQTSPDPAFREVSDVAVVGMSEGSAHDEAPTAYVVPPQNLHNDAKRLEELAELMMDHMDRYYAGLRILRGGVVFIDTMPTTDGSRPSRRELREQQLAGTVRPIAAFPKPDPKNENTSPHDSDRD